MIHHMLSMRQLHKASASRDKLLLDCLLLRVKLKRPQSKWCDGLGPNFLAALPMVWTWTAC